MLSQTSRCCLEAPLCALRATHALKWKIGPKHAQTVHSGSFPCFVVNSNPLGITSGCPAGLSIECTVEPCSPCTRFCSITSRHYSVQDVVMPEGGDGLDLLEHVKNNPAWATIPVVSAPHLITTIARLAAAIPASCQVQLY